jgi:HK97 family phage prohead protease
MTTITRTATLGATARSPIRAVLATSRKQADGYALSMAGARLGRFRANPVLMTVHDYKSLPVGRISDISIERDRITGRLLFPSDAEGQALEQRVRDGFINAVSIGYDVIESDRAGQVSAWSLTEVSLVGVPMDADALIYARGHGGGRQIRTVNRAAAQRLLDAITFYPAETLSKRVDRILREVIIRTFRDGR